MLATTSFRWGPLVALLIFSVSLTLVLVLGLTKRADESANGQETFLDVADDTAASLQDAIVDHLQGEYCAFHTAAKTPVSTTTPRPASSTALRFCGRAIAREIDASGAIPPQDAFHLQAQGLRLDTGMAWSDIVLAVNVTDGQRDAFERNVRAISSPVLLNSTAPPRGPSYMPAVYVNTGRCARAACAECGGGSRACSSGELLQPRTIECGPLLLVGLHDSTQGTESGRLRYCWARH